MFMWNEMKWERKLAKQITKKSPPGTPPSDFDFGGFSKPTSVHSVSQWGFTAQNWERKKLIYFCLIIDYQMTLINTYFDDN